MPLGVKCGFRTPQDRDIQLSKSHPRQTGGRREEDPVADSERCTGVAWLEGERREGREIGEGGREVEEGERWEKGGGEREGK